MIKELDLKVISEEVRKILNNEKLDGYENKDTSKKERLNKIILDLIDINIFRKKGEELILITLGNSWKMKTLLRLERKDNKIIQMKIGSLDSHINYYMCGAEYLTIDTKEEYIVNYTNIFEVLKEICKLVDINLVEEEDSWYIEREINNRLMKARYIEDLDIFEDKNYYQCFLCKYFDNKIEFCAVNPISLFSNRCEDMEYIKDG